MFRIEQTFLLSSCCSPMSQRLNTRKRSMLTKNIAKNSSRHSFEPFNCDLKQLRINTRVRVDEDYRSGYRRSLVKSLISFLKQKPTPTQLHKLYDTMLFIARDDVTRYCGVFDYDEEFTRENVTRAAFDFYCEYIPIEDGIKKEAKRHVNAFMRSLRTLLAKKKEQGCKLLPSEPCEETIKIVIQHTQKYKWLAYIHPERLKSIFKHCARARAYHTPNASPQDLSLYDWTLYWLQKEVVKIIVQHKYSMNPLHIDSDMSLQDILVAYEILNHLGVL